MYFLIGSVVVFIIGFIYFKFFNTSLLNKEAIDAELEAKQKMKEEELEELEKKIDKIEEKMKKLTPKEIENYWNDESNN